MMLGEAAGDPRPENFIGWSSAESSSESVESYSGRRQTHPFAEGDRGEALNRASAGLSDLLQRSAGRPLTRDERRLERRYRATITAAFNSEE